MKNAPLATLKVIWTAFLSFQFLLAGMPFLLWISSHPGESLSALPFWETGKMSSPVYLVIQGFAFLEAVVAFFLPRFAKKGRQPLFIFQMALFEGVSLLGVMLAMLSGNPHHVLPFAIVGMVGILSNLPTEDRL